MTAVRRALEDLPPRRPLTVAEVEAMATAGILAPDERVELIEGALVAISPKGNHHEVLNLKLNLFWAAKLPKPLWLVTEATFQISRLSYLEPDFVVFQRSVGLAGLAPATALLVVEVADSSLDYDLGPKAQLYAQHGVGELWVIDALAERVHVHRKPSTDGYAEITPHDRNATLTPINAPELALALADLDAI